MPSIPSFLADLNPAIYHSQNYVVVDIEVDTGHGDFGRPIFADNRMLLACWMLGSGHRNHRKLGNMQAYWGDELHATTLYEDMASADFIVAHNAIYELGWFSRGGYNIASILPFDTQLAEYVLLGNLVSGHNATGVPPTSISLDACALRKGWEAKDHVVNLLMGNHINPARMPRKWLEDRCKQDVKTTHELFKRQLVDLSNSNRLPILYTRCLLTPVLATIQTEGLGLAKERVEAEYKAYSASLGRTEEKLRHITGGINTASGKQRAAFLYDKLGFAERMGYGGKPKRTATGQRATDSSTLSALVAKTGDQREFLEVYKEQSRLSAAITKNLAFFKGVCDEQDSVFYADLNQTRTATHRLSSTGIPNKFGSVQFQNLPRSFKRLFKAKRKDWLIGEIDGKQLEFRVAAFLGQDRQAMADISDPNFDAHVTSGAAKEGIAYEELLTRYRAGDKKAKDIRQDAKPDTFKPLYGGSKGTKKQERWYKAFRERYPDLAKAQQGWVNEVVYSKRLVTPWGLQYYFPHARISASGYCNVTTSVYNYPVQALATAEIIPIALVYFYHRLLAAGLDTKIKLVNTVHDSVVCEIAPDMDIPVYKQLAQQCFVDDVYNYLRQVYGLDFNVPLGQDTTIGHYLGENQ